ncbi:class I SAM-dependent methyltransferase [Methanosarcina sp. DH1]|uniref:class I SAM-dependent methyltransferase n=1 Tax=Methanosarcina sp. DH1 TaxID=2605695 RepID=UPI001E3D0D95|nr:class I SAM-dependent methyltransferase [Methanosarcina sp. DH1]
MEVHRAFNYMQRLILKKTFSLWQTLGLHITANHFYEPIPDTSTLNVNLWLKCSELVGIDFNEQEQIYLLSEFGLKYKEELDSFPRNRTECPYQYFSYNGAFESVDGDILYCMIRQFKPQKIIEIGSGNSTYLSAQAALKNKTEDGYECEMVSIEPYPNNVLKRGFPGLSQLITQKVQDLPLSLFDSLEENDILFIDSSHVLKIGNDVQYEYLEVLPRLKKGVIIHIHDIFLPEEYRKDWVLDMHRFWNEQYLLQAFLTFNESFKVLWAGNYMCLTYPDKIEKTFSSYKRDKVKPSSFWIVKTR